VDIYSKELNTGKIDTCIPMFIMALFTIVKSWKQLMKWSRMDEWMDKEN
jgi:hypothetical protein